MNIEEVIKKRLDSLYPDHYIVGPVDYQKSGDIETLYYQTSNGNMTFGMNRYHMLVMYFWETLYQDSNIVDSKHRHTLVEINQRAYNYLTHRAEKVKEQLPIQ